MEAELALLFIHILKQEKITIVVIIFCIFQTAALEEQETLENRIFFQFLKFKFPSIKKYNLLPYCYLF